jgi:hypothetical protein
MERRSPRATSILSVLLGLLGCVVSLPACDSSDDDDVAGSCPDDELFNATACDEEYCGPPIARLGTGLGGYESLEDGDEVDIRYGSQGGFHIDITVEMDNLCQIVFIRPSMLVDPGDGGALIPVFDQNRHVQAVRVEPTESTLQQFWGIRGFVPCEYWPIDLSQPQSGPGCGPEQGSAGMFQDFELEIRLEVEDHNGRIASDSKRVQPVCCN